MGVDEEAKKVLSVLRGRTGRDGRKGQHISCAVLCVMVNAPPVPHGAFGCRQGFSDLLSSIW